MKKSFIPACFTALVAALASANSFAPYNLKCDQLTNPIGIEKKSPKFSWQSFADSRDFMQGQYRILVASAPGLLAEGQADIWDSDWVESDRSTGIDFGGASLQTGTRYFWSVNIKDKAGTEAGYSAPAWFVTALIGDKKQYKAQWIAFEENQEIIYPFIDEPVAKNTRKVATIGQYRMPQFRKEFRLKEKPVREALAFISGLGHFELFMNGDKVGNNFLDPGWTRYDKEAQYMVFDLKDYLEKGANTIGVMLGNGFYNVPNQRYFKITGSFGAPKLWMVTKIVYEDGEEQTIVTDTSWRVTGSPITYSSIYSGEDFDATKIIEGWRKSGFDDKKWYKPVVVNADSVQLYSLPGNALRIREQLPAMTVSETPAGNLLYDFGQNFSGICRIKVRGKKGDRIIMRPGELTKDGEVTQHPWGVGTPVYYVYTIGRDDETETWQPQFTYFGQRYLQIEGARRAGNDSTDTRPEILEVTGLHTTSALNPVGEFRSSNQLFNKTHELIDWAVRSNVASVLTDCPHREKLGWQEEAHLMQHSLQYRYDLSGLYPKILRDLKGAQHDNGCMPTIAPQYVVFNEGFGDTPEWGSTSIISPWYYYQWYGDDSLLKEYYPQMRRYGEYLGSKAENHIVSYGLGDWYDIGPNPPGYAQLTSNALTATAIYYTDIKILAKTASLLGLTADADKYSALADSIKSAFNDLFYNDSCGCYERGSQTANAIALATGLADGGRAEKALQSLVKDITDRNYSLTAGDVGYKYVLEALTNAGQADVVYKMNSRYDTPGYGWQIAKGATALTEAWQAYDFASNNHFMLGHIMEWFYSALAGIRQTDNSVGFKTVMIKPIPCGDLTSVSGSLETPYGKVVSEWEKKDDLFIQKVTIPANTTAEVWLPATDAAQVTEHGKALADITGLHSVELVDDRLRLEIGSGTYRFEIR